MAESERPQVVLVNRCVIKNEADELLLLRRAATDEFNPGRWEFPGGKLDSGQDLRQALEREVFEETGLQVEPLSPLVYADSFIITEGKYIGFPYVVLFGVAKVLSGKLRLSSEHDRSVWVPKQDAFDQYDLTNESSKALQALGGTLLKDI